MLRRAKLVVLSVCRVVTEVDDHQSRATSPVVEYLVEIQQTIFIGCRENKFVKLCSLFNRQIYNFFLISPKRHSIFIHFWWKWASRKWLIFQQKDIFFSGKWQLFQYNIASWPARRHIIHLMNNALRIIRYLLYISTLEISKYVAFMPKVLQCCSVAVRFPLLAYP